ncbi:MAG: fibrobacter succinogenes major paralogous domain-containing protein [Candidatus Peribacteria bacterium]|jgi:hypothetical protein|nr:fibrobacter succinogenes major paralogous domain-containing protein [Candidatus Peribacteria bacterium]
MGERNQLLIARAGVNGVNLTDYGNGYYYFNNTTNAKKFRDAFLLPLAGYRYYDSSATVYYQGDYSYYWSSTLNGSNARSLSLSTSTVSTNNRNTRATGFSLRCFKDS